ncbi:MAG: HEPN domain-containing protein [Candidatus Bathyarchaeia archaeon]
MSSESTQYLRKAEARLEAAEELLRAGRYEDTVSRAYYCVLCCARAALTMKDSHPKTHEGTLRMFGELFVKGEGWPKMMGVNFSRLKALMEKADYSPSIEVTGEDAEWSLQVAKDFLRETISRLKTIL